VLAQAAETAASSEIGITFSDDGARKTKKTIGNARNKGEVFHSNAKQSSRDRTANHAYNKFRGLAYDGMAIPPSS